MANITRNGDFPVCAGSGLLELSLTSGYGSLNRFRKVIVRRSWAGDADGSSVWASVETVGDTECNQVRPARALAHHAHRTRSPGMRHDTRSGSTFAL